MASILLKAKDIEVNLLFRDPETDTVYVMRAHDPEEGRCLAQTPDGEFWQCDADYEVYTEPTQVRRLPNPEVARETELDMVNKLWKEGHRQLKEVRAQAEVLASELLAEKNKHDLTVLEVRRLRENAMEAGTDGPPIELQELLNGGMNAFGLKLFVESLKDYIGRNGRFTFNFMGHIVHVRKAP